MTLKQREMLTSQRYTAYQRGIFKLYKKIPVRVFVVYLQLVTLLKICNASRNGCVFTRRSTSVRQWLFINSTVAQVKNSTETEEVVKFSGIVTNTDDNMVRSDIGELVVTFSTDDANQFKGFKGSCSPGIYFSLKCHSVLQIEQIIIILFNY